MGGGVLRTHAWELCSTRSTSLHKRLGDDGHHVMHSHNQSIGEHSAVLGARCLDGAHARAVAVALAPAEALRHEALGARDAARRRVHVVR